MVQVPVFVYAVVNYYPPARKMYQFRFPLIIVDSFEYRFERCHYTEVGLSDYCKIYNNLNTDTLFYCNTPHSKSRRLQLYCLVSRIRPTRLRS